MKVTMESSAMTNICAPLAGISNVDSTYFFSNCEGMSWSYIFLVYNYVMTTEKRGINDLSIMTAK